MLMALLLLSAAGGPSSDVCDRRAQIEAIRRDDAGRPALRKALEEEVAKATGKHKACAAAAAAEAALFSGDKPRASALIDVLLSEMPELLPHVGPHQLLLWAETGKVAEAEAGLAVLDPKNVQWRDRIELALAQARKDPVASAVVLNRMSSRDGQALDALCAQGKADACRDLLLRHPTHALARAREDSVDVTPWDAASIALRLQGLLKGARPKRVVHEGTRWLAKHPADEAHRVRATMGSAWLRLEKPGEAVLLTQLDLANTTPSDDVLERLRVLAKARAREGHAENAAILWRSLAGVGETMKRPDVVAEGAFFSAFSYAEDNQITNALTAWELAAPRVKDTAYEIPTLWYRAFLTLTAKKDHGQALALFTTLVDKKDPKEDRKHRYWRARAMEQLEKKAQAKAEKEALVREDPLDWYGQLARRDLGLPVIKGTKVLGDGLEQLIKPDDETARVQLLAKIGFEEEAKQACRSRASREGDRPTLANLGLCQSVDDFFYGYRRGSYFTPVPTVTKHKLVPQAAWRVSYATPWRAEVEAAAAEANVPASFVYAIMRTESGFDPNAVSVAGARGLVQLLPSVKRGIQKLVPTATTDLRAGTALLGLFVKEHGSLMLGAAAYNGAPENVQAWVSKWGALPIDEFVERVPFKETRDYIKRVLAVEALYRGLEGGEAAIALPSSPLPPAASFTRFPYDE